jgi:hypothetical protein
MFKVCTHPVAGAANKGSRDSSILGETSRIGQMSAARMEPRVMPYS